MKLLVTDVAIFSAWISQMAKTNRVLIRTLYVTIILRNIILIVIEQVGKLSYNIVACVP